MRHCRNPHAGELHYGLAMGFEGLRDAICTYLRTSRAVRCEPQQVMIVSGSQQALEISARVLLDPGERVVVEDPHYQLAVHSLLAYGAQVA